MCYWHEAKNTIRRILLRLQCQALWRLQKNLCAQLTPETPQNTRSLTVDEPQKELPFLISCLSSNITITPCFLSAGIHFLLCLTPELFFNDWYFAQEKKKGCKEYTLHIYILHRAETLELAVIGGAGISASCSTPGAVSAKFCCC